MNLKRTTTIATALCTSLLAATSALAADLVHDAEF